MEHPTLKVQLKTVAEFMGFKVYPDDAYVMPAAYNCIKQKDVPIYYDDYKAFMGAWVRFRDSPAPDGHHVEFFDCLNSMAEDSCKAELIPRGMKCFQISPIIM